jgi:cellulose binding protein with CBM2 domain/fibronectin type III domain protein
VATAPTYASSGTPSSDPDTRVSRCRGRAFEPAADGVQPGGGPGRDGLQAGQVGAQVQLLRPEHRTAGLEQFHRELRVPGPYGLGRCVGRPGRVGQPGLADRAAQARPSCGRQQLHGSAVTEQGSCGVTVLGGAPGGTIAVVPGTPAQPAVTGLSSSTSGNTTGTGTLTWKAPAAGTYPVAKYDVYQGGSLLTTQTGAGLQLTGLTIGASYSCSVVAVHSQGNASLPSSPVTITVPPPADASCAVKYEIVNSWQGGFIGSITVTNRAAAPINGRTLTFTWPAAGESLQSGWNAAWTRTGQQVTVTGEAWSGTIAANGGTTTIGFQGIETAQKPASAAFYLNNTVCSNI